MFADFLHRIPSQDKLEGCAFNLHPAQASVYGAYVAMTLCCLVGTQFRTVTPDQSPVVQPAMAGLSANLGQWGNEAPQPPGLD